MALRGHGRNEKPCKVRGPGPTCPLFAMSTITTNTTPGLSLADSIAITRLRLQVMEREVEMNLPFATEEQLAAVISATEGFAAGAKTGVGTKFRLSEEQREAVKAARARHSASATLAKDKIADEVRNASVITRYKFKPTRDGKIAGQVSFVS